MMQEVRPNFEDQVQSDRLDALTGYADRKLEELRPRYQGSMLVTVLGEGLEAEPKGFIIDPERYTDTYMENLILGGYSLGREGNLVRLEII